MKLVQRIRKSLAFRLNRHATGIESKWLDSHLEHLGLGHAKRIQTFTTAAELEALYNLAAACPHDSAVTEIGSYLGASTCYIAAGLQSCGGHLHCVDTWQNETMPDGTRDTFAEFQRNVAPVASIISPIRKQSNEVLPSELPSGCPLAFIDGDHSYSAVNLDVKLLAPKISDEGVLAFHDAVCFSGVSKMIGELLASGEWTLSGKVENLVWLKRGKPAK